LFSIFVSFVFLKLVKIGNFWNKTILTQNTCKNQEKKREKITKVFAQ